MWKPLLQAAYSFSQFWLFTSDLKGTLSHYSSSILVLDIRGFAINKFYVPCPKLRFISLKIDNLHQNAQKVTTAVGYSLILMSQFQALKSLAANRWLHFVLFGNIFQDFHFLQFRNAKTNIIFLWNF